MGNQFNLTKSCMSLGQVCQQNFNQEQSASEVFTARRNALKSTDQIRQKIIQFTHTYRLHLYSIRQRKLFQTLISVGQEHILLKIIELDKKVKQFQQEKKNLIRTKQRQAQKINQKQKQNTQKPSTQDLKIENINTQINKTKQARQKLFSQCENLLLEDLDMIFQQINKFDANNQQISNILALSQHLLINGNQNTESNLLSLTHEKQAQISQLNDLTKSNGFNLGLSTNNFKSTNGSFLTTSHTGKQKVKKFTGKNQQKKLKQQLKIEDKKSLNKNPTLIASGVASLSNSQLLIVAPIECFSGIGALKNNKKTGLPSGATLLGLFINKVKAVTIRRHCNIGVVFIVNQKHVSQLQQALKQIKEIYNKSKIQKLQTDSNFQNTGSEYDSQSSLYYNLISFKNVWPCFDQNLKISINSQSSQINFEYQNGDLIAFIQNNIELKMIAQKYKYINITNVNNMLSIIGDSSVIGYLETHEERDVAAKLLRPSSQQFQLSQFFVSAEKQFIQVKNIGENQLMLLNKNNQKKQQQEQRNTQVYTPNRPFLNIEDYYIKSRIFTTHFGPLKRLLMARIKRQLSHQNTTLSFYLKRQISDIFYSKFTSFILVDQLYEFSHVKTSQSQYQFKPYVNKNGHIGYSRYCKKLLGLNNSQTNKQSQQLVEIDAGVLHKGSQQLKKLIQKLSVVKQAGFPIIIYSNFCNSLIQQDNQNNS